MITGASSGKVSAVIVNLRLLLPEFENVSFSYGMMAMADRTECPKCGKVYTRIQELLNVHNIGLALFGTCPACGARVPCAELWHCTVRLTEPITAPTMTRKKSGT